jgi:hypothetical protein
VGAGVNQAAGRQLAIAGLDDRIPHFVFLKLDCEIKNKLGKLIRTAVHFANIHGHVY